MARLYLVRITSDRTKTLFWVSEFAAGCAFVVLMLALLFAPYALGCLPEVEGELIGGLR